MQELSPALRRPRRNPTLRRALMAFAAVIATAGLPLGGLHPGAARAATNNPFAPVIFVNDSAITRYAINQRARMLTLLRAPGDAQKLARQQLTDEALQMQAAKTAGISIDDTAIQGGMKEFAGRVNMDVTQLVKALEGAGVARQTFRDFVRAGLTWRAVVQAKFVGKVAVSPEDIDRARTATGDTSGVSVLLSQIVLPFQGNDPQKVQDLAKRIAANDDATTFARDARQYSAAPSHVDGGKMPWTSLSKLPAGLRPVILGLAPGKISEPLPINGGIALFLLHDIREGTPPKPDYAAIEYAAYYIAGGKSPEALARAAQVAAQVDTCDDLYGIAKGQPPQVLERFSKAPKDIPADVARELTKLDPGETSATLTRKDGTVLMFLMLCGRTPKIEGGGPSTDDLTNFIRNQRIDSLAKGYLEQLRAEARIIEK